MSDDLVKRLREWNVSNVDVREAAEVLEAALARIAELESTLEINRAFNDMEFSARLQQELDAERKRADANLAMADRYHRLHMHGGKMDTVHPFCRDCAAIDAARRRGHERFRYS